MTTLKCDTEFGNSLNLRKQAKFMQSLVCVLFALVEIDS